MIDFKEYLTPRKDPQQSSLGYQYIYFGDSLDNTVDIADGYFPSHPRSVHIETLDGSDKVFANLDGKSLIKAFIDGGDKDDEISAASDGDITIMGGNGNDTIHIETRNVTDPSALQPPKIDLGRYVDGGAGDDFIFTNEQYDNVTPYLCGPGDDVFSAGDLSSSVSAWGEEGQDFLTGSNKHDLLMGGSEDDTVEGSLGRDTIYGGSNNDQLDGGRGKDYLNGGSGNDTIKSGRGSDIIHISPGDDIIIRLNPFKDRIIVDNDLINSELQYKNRKNGCFIKDDDQINTFFKKINSDQLMAIIEIV